MMVVGICADFGSSDFVISYIYRPMANMAKQKKKIKSGSSQARAELSALCIKLDMPIS